MQISLLVGWPGESWKVFKGGYKCQASRESPVDSILPGSTVRPSAAAMASFDVAVANCEGVILPERSASNWSASCSHMRTLSPQNKITHRYPVWSHYRRGTSKQRQGHRRFQELLLRGICKVAFLI